MSLEEAILRNTQAVSELNTLFKEFSKQFNDYVIADKGDTEPANDPSDVLPGMQNKDIVIAASNLQNPTLPQVPPPYKQARRGRPPRKDNEVPVSDTPLVPVAAQSADALPSTQHAAPAAPAPSAAVATVDSAMQAAASTYSTETIQPWAPKTHPVFLKLRDQPANLVNIKTAIMAIDTHAGRDKANAVLARFGANAVSERPGRAHLTENNYVEAYGYMLRVLAGATDPEGSEPPSEDSIL